MKIEITIFSIFFIISGVCKKSAKVLNATTLGIANQNIGLYDYFQQRLNHFQDNYEADSFNKDKRALTRKYSPLYDEFKRRLDNFNAAILMDKDAQTLANENLYKGGSDCLCALENKSNDNEDKMRSNRGFFKYFGFDSNSKENDKNIAKITKSHKVSANKGENKSKQIGRGKSKASFKIEDKGALVEVKPGTLYDEYMKQIGKIIDVHIS